MFDNWPNKCLPSDGRPKVDQTTHAGDIRTSYADPRQVLVQPGGLAFASAGDRAATALVCHAVANRNVSLVRVVPNQSFSQTKAGWRPGATCPPSFFPVRHEKPGGAARVPWGANLSLAASGLPAAPNCGGQQMPCKSVCVQRPHAAEQPLEAIGHAPGLSCTATRPACRTTARAQQDPLPGERSA